MQVRWEYLTPADFKALAQKEKLCILPIGSLERHGEHLPFGTDALIVHTVAVRAAQQEPCVVFPPYWFGQVHEAACFAGTVNFNQKLLLEMLETLVDQIAGNGFEKILILNGHGGNTHFLQYFAMSQCDRELDYTIYTGFYQGERFNAVPWETQLQGNLGGHADEIETSLMMAIAPEAVKMEYQKFREPVDPLYDTSSLGVYTGYWWYALYPEHVNGCPSLASREKGEKALEAAAADVAEMIRKLKADTLTPSLQKEFYKRMRNK
ncbi:MAG: creatininase family protein [Treponema sp.]|jgi:creatinine amidohydrolase|nr:creatininase family protein [Treponema sp.]